MTRSCTRLLGPHIRPLVAHSLEEALQVIDAGEHLDAVWSDRHLPDSNAGVAVLRRAAERHQGALLLLVTADPARAGLETLPAGTRIFDKADAAEAIALVIATLRGA